MDMRVPNLFIPVGYNCFSSKLLLFEVNEGSFPTDTVLLPTTIKEKKKGKPAEFRAE